MCVRGRPILVGNQIGIILMDIPKHISIVIAARNHLLSTPHREISRRVDLRYNLRQHVALLPDLASTAVTARSAARLPCPPGRHARCRLPAHAPEVLLSKQQVKLSSRADNR